MAYGHHIGFPELKQVSKHNPQLIHAAVNNFRTTVNALLRKLSLNYARVSRSSGDVGIWDVAYDLGEGLRVLRSRPQCVCARRCSLLVVPGGSVYDSV